MSKAMIRGREVAVREGKTVVFFAGGEQGDQESGDYHFWTAVGEDEFGDWKTICRALSHLPAEDRFLRMDSERATDKIGASRLSYRNAWRRLQTAALIRPSTMRELVQWMASHEADSKLAEPFAYLDGIRHIIPRSLV